MFKAKKIDRVEQKLAEIEKATKVTPEKNERINALRKDLSREVSELGYCSVAENNFGR